MLKLFTLADINLDAAGTRQRVSVASVPVTTVVFSAKKANTGKIYIGDSNVSVTRGIELEAGETIALTADLAGRPGAEELDLSDLYFDGGTTGDDVGVAYFQRK